MLKSGEINQTKIHVELRKSNLCKRPSFNIPFCLTERMKSDSACIQKFKLFISTEERQSTHAYNKYKKPQIMQDHIQSSSQR